MSRGRWAPRNEAEARELLKVAARERLRNFVRRVRPQYAVTPFHAAYLRVMGMFAAGRVRRLIVQVAPQHGKSEISSRLLPAFMLGRDPELRIAIGSYSSAMARDFSRDVQRIIDTPGYAELFPGTRLSDGSRGGNDGAAQRTSDAFDIVGRGGSLHAVGRGGSLTGRTVDVAILDDVYKDYAEGNSPVVREAAWKWYTNVVRTRLHNRSQELIVFTRWNEDDLIGRIVDSGEAVVDVERWSDLDSLPATAWARINFEAIKTGAPTEIDPRGPGEALWPERHSLERLEAARRLDPVMFQCLYQGRPGDASARLYQPFKTWADKSEWGEYVRTGCYVDVADGGGDYLFAAAYEVRRSQSVVWNERTRRYDPLLYALITDMMMTDEGTEVTTVTVPDLINRNGVQRVWIESNNGGAQFEKVVRRRVRAATVPFHQSANKESRVLTAAAMVSGQIVMPLGWEQRFPKIHAHLTGFLRDFSANAHDDPEDGLTGIYEKELAACNVQPYRTHPRGVRLRN